MWLAVALLLPYYGAEAYGLNELGRYAADHGDPGVLDVADAFRYAPFEMTTFALGLFVLVLVGGRIAHGMWRSGRVGRTGGILAGLGLATYLPQFFGTPEVRVAHGARARAGPGADGGGRPPDGTTPGRTSNAAAGARRLTRAGPDVLRAAAGATAAQDVRVGWVSLLVGDQHPEGDVDQELRPGQRQLSTNSTRTVFGDMLALPIYVTGPIGSDEAGAGLAFGSFVATSLVCRPFAGRYSDRFGRRPVMAVGAGLAALGMALMPHVGTLAGVVALRLVLGVGEAAFFVAGFALLADLAPAERMGEALSYNSLGLYLGIAFGPPLGELLLERGGFEAAWYGGAVLALVAVVLVFLLREPPRTDPEAVTAG